MSNIAAIETRLFRIPLNDVLSDAGHGDHTHFELITVTIRQNDGLEGTGYTYTGGRGGRAIKAMIDHDLSPLLLGKSAANVERLNEDMQWHVHYVGRGGVASFAISAVDIALWDLRGKAAGSSLRQMAGGAKLTSKVYGGGIDLSFDRDKLLANIQGYLEKGLDAVKIKVGRENLAEDVERLLAVRDLIGPHRTVMVDANFAFDRERAVAAAHAFKPANLTWFEEPIIPEDYEGYAEIGTRTGVPMAMGENLHTIHEFELAFRCANLAFIQPDTGNCGGITAWMSIAEMSVKYGIPICTHGMPELNVSLLAGHPNGAWLEWHSFPIDEYTKRPLVVEDGVAVAPNQPGTGVMFDWNKLEEHEVIQQ